MKTEIDLSILEARYAEREADEARRRQADQVSAAMRGLAGDIGADHRGATLENFTPHDPTIAPVVGRLRKLIDTGELRATIRRGGGLILLGGSGVGKDHLAVALLKLLTSQAVTCRWINCQSLFVRLADGAREGAAARIIREMSRSTVLCLSDPVLTGALSEPRATLLYGIVETRKKLGLSTWTTMNVTDEADGMARLSPQVFGRLVDRSICIKCNWPDYRRGRARG